MTRPNARRLCALRLAAAAVLLGSLAPRAAAVALAQSAASRSQLEAAAATASTAAALIDAGVRELLRDDLEASPVSLMAVAANATHALSIHEALAATDPGSVDATSYLLGGKGPPVKLDKVAVDKAAAVLNDKLYKAQVRLDSKHVECDEAQRRNRRTLEQVRNDLDRLAAELAGLEKRRAVNTASSNLVAGQSQRAEEEQQAALSAFKEQAARDKPEFWKRQQDLTAAKRMLELTRCKGADGKPGEAASLLQQEGFKTSAARGLRSARAHTGDSVSVSSAHRATATGLEACHDASGRVARLQFEDAELSDAGGRLSDKGREMLVQAVRGVRGGSEGAGLATSIAFMGAAGLEALDDGDSFNSSRSSDPTGKVQVGPATEARDTYCMSVAPDCGELHDTFAVLWGDMKDSVEELAEKMHADETKWKELDASFNAQIVALTAQRGTISSELGEITSQSNTAAEEMERQKELAKEIEDDYEKMTKECHSTMTEILYSEVCGTTKVRNALLKASLGLKDSDIVDCAVTKWAAGPCSATCDDTLVGGIQQLTRKVLVPQQGYGVACPRLTVSARCAQIKCPVDCKLTDFSSYSSCTKECGGGVQSRIRNVDTRASHGGKACPALQDTRVCNTGSCDRDCLLRDWTSWSACSQACDGGIMERRRKKLKPARAEGTCPAKEAPARLQRQPCNVQACAPDEVCVAKLDVVLALDASGSLSEKGFDVIKTLATKVVKRLRNSAYGHSAVRASIVEFGDGHLDSSGVVSDAQLVLPLTSDMDTVGHTISSLKRQTGFTNMAQAVMKAHQVLKQSSRIDADSVMVLITDGRPSFKLQLLKAVQELRSTSRLLVVHVKESPAKVEQALMQSIVSHPADASYMLIPGKKELKKNYDGFARQLLVKLCPRSESPSSLEQQGKLRGFQMILEGKSCKTSPDRSIQAASPDLCYEDASGAGEFASFEFKEPTEFAQLVSPVNSVLGSVSLGTCRIFRVNCTEHIEEARVRTFINVPKSFEAAL